ncbi:unnamed protein product [Dibothriocephalus latus]|uniref:BTB domain-containing protein n=1 Tax=Dibothriocephalus latus TaxID=60516 RepID=A0A3P7LZB9_DIBLA|nr:unnamed protein product [Dibothriocephalus latus]
MTHKETQMFEDQLALIHCLPQLNNLRVDKKLTDLTIELQDSVKVHAHRIVLASRVPSLCDGLCESPTKGQAVVLKWPTVSSEIATTFIDYIYTGQLEVHEANVAGLIVLSQQLVMPHMEKWVVSFMAARLNSENVSHNWELAQLLKSDQLKNVCLQHIKATFEATGASDCFIQLPSDAVLSLLRADDLQVDSEESIFEAIGRWVSPLGEVDETRVVHAAAMMKEMRWYQVDTDFRYRVKDDDEAFWNKNFKCSRLLGRITKWIDAPSSRGDRQCPFNERPRGQIGGSADSECLLNAEHHNPLEDICLLGKSQNGEECLLSWYDADTNTTQKLTDVTDELNAAFVAIEDCIFVIGGNKQKDNYLNLRKFDTKERGWTKCAPLRHWKTDHTAVAVAVGGEAVICVCGGTYWSNECMLYSPPEDK